MDYELKEAIRLRKEGFIEEACILLKRFVKINSKNAEAVYYLAITLDALGKEKEAVPYYNKALELDLELEKTKKAFIGLGSTYASAYNWDLCFNFR